LFGTQQEKSTPKAAASKHNSSETVGEGTARTPGDKPVDPEARVTRPVKKSPGEITTADAIDRTLVLPADALPDDPDAASPSRRIEAAALNKTAAEKMTHDATGIRQADVTMASAGPLTGSSSSLDELQFEQLGGYRILKVLGRGAMGTVYLANQTSLDRQVALKTIQGPWCQDPATVARFTREAYAAAQLENCLACYNGFAATKSRSLVALGFCGATILLSVFSLIFSITLAGGWLAMLAGAVSCYLVVRGLRDRGVTFSKLRELMYTYRRSDWLTSAFGGLVLLAIMLLVAPVVVWLAFAFIGSLAGAAFYLFIDRQLAVSRQEPLAELEAMLKKLRIGGLDELSLQQFVANYGGDLWEEMFETLFGYDAKIVAREALQDSGQRPRKRFRGWRDPLIRRIDERLRRHRATHDRRHLENIEAAALQATGLDAGQARHQAEDMAAVMIDLAAAARRAREPVDPQVAADARRARFKAMLAEARSASVASTPSPIRFLTGPLVFVFGAKLRFFVGGGLLVGCLLWMNQLGMFSSEDGILDSLNSVRAIGPSEPWNMPIVGGLFNSFNPGIAGVMLLFAAGFRDLVRVASGGNHGFRPGKWNSRDGGLRGRADHKFDHRRRDRVGRFAFRSNERRILLNAIAPSLGLTVR
jgi:hypothetical protein